jgi:ABC-type transport system involved in multi-copper enzyme maturation permease subunit
VNHPEVRVPLHDLQNQYAEGSVPLVNGIFLLFVVTMMVWGLTLFSRVDPQRKASAVLFGIWLYAIPALRWTKLGFGTSLQYEYASGLKLCWSGVTALLFLVASFGVLKGLLITSVGLFESLCGNFNYVTDWASLSMPRFPQA